MHIQIRSLGSCFSLSPAGIQQLTLRSRCMCSVFLPSLPSFPATFGVTIFGGILIPRLKDASAAGFDCEPLTAALDQADSRDTCSGTQGIAILMSDWQLVCTRAGTLILVLRN